MEPLFQLIDHHWEKPFKISLWPISWQGRSCKKVINCAKNHKKEVGVLHYKKCKIRYLHVPGMVGGWAGGLTISRWTLEQGLQEGSAEPAPLICHSLPTSLPPLPWISAFALCSLHALSSCWAFCLVSLNLLLWCLGFSSAIPNWPEGCTLQGPAPLAGLCYKRHHSLSQPCQRTCLLSQGFLQGWDMGRGR